jgi:hypothetical protein
MHRMSEAETKLKVHIISVPGENDVGTKRFRVLHAAAERAAEAYKIGFYLEAITLTESLLATRLESRLTWVRQCQKKSGAAKFSTLGDLCTKLLSGNAKVAPDWDAFQAPLQEISKWVKQRNEALHEMAKLVEGEGHNFNKSYARCRATALEGFRALIEYDAIDRKERLKAKKTTATDNLHGGTAFDCLSDLE